MPPCPAQGVIAFMVSSPGGPREHLGEKSPGRRQSLLGAVMLVGAPLLVLAMAQAVPWRHLVLALGVLLLTGAGGYLLARPGLAALLAAAASALSPGRPFHWTDLVLAALLALLAGLLAVLARRHVRAELTAGDGLLAVALMFLLSVALTLLSGLTSQQLASQSALMVLLVYLLTPPLELTAVLLILLHAGAVRSFVARYYRWHRDTGRQLAEGFTWGIAIILLTAIVVSAESHVLGVSIVPNNPFVYSPHMAKAAWPQAALLILAVVVLAPLAEEALFRGLLYGGFRRRLPLWAAAGLSAVIFGGAHMNVSLFVPLTLAGLILAMVFEKSQSLWPSTVAHATLNGVSVLLALLLR